MTITTTIRKLTTAALLVLAPAVQATPIVDFEIGYDIAFQLPLGLDQTAYIHYGVNEAYAMSLDGEQRAGSTAVFLAISILDRPLAVAPVSGDTVMSATDGTADASASIIDGELSAAADVAALAAALGEIVAGPNGDDLGLSADVEALALGLGEAWVTSADMLLNAGSIAVTEGSGLSSVTLSGDETLTSAVAAEASTLSDAFIFSNGNLGQNLSDASALADGELLGLDSELLGVNALTDTFSLVEDGELAAFANATVNAFDNNTELGQLLNDVIALDASATSLGLGVSDAYATVSDDDRLLAGSSASFLSISAAEGLGGVLGEDQVLALAGGVETLVFGYAEAWLQLPYQGGVLDTDGEDPGPDVQAVPVPATVGLFALGLFALGLTLKTGRPRW